ncbi:cytochrome c-type biogenesis protein CcmH/NrfG [Pseudoclavibacter sp. JAI123]|uniref:hypothetical protein n=1 Tax=Pseudoclavibacter sp. JAI123 TaxID=2723065 RepID=UPI0015CE9EE0|nr:hypothetical protein [Pseudoclavibacter sp. JAI123]NYF13427.1 cytochrome c-type biogenesis protein CcmH/NrfG [Pseudoclavibacter sp. JAI123]
MKRNLATKLGVAAVTLLLLLYVVFVTGMAVSLFAGDIVAKIMGAALIVFPVLAVVFIARELLFGMQTERLLRRLADAGELPEDDLAKRPSGRVVREAADEDFPKWKAEVEAAPDDWRAWMRLGLAYSASGDRKRARSALREGIRLEKVRPEGA